MIGNEGTLVNIGLACIVSIISYLIAFEIRKRTIELRATSSGTTSAVPFMLSLFFVLVSIESILFAMRLAAGFAGHMETDEMFYKMSQVLVAFMFVPQVFVITHVFTENIKKSRFIAIFFAMVAMVYIYVIFAYDIHQVSSSFWGTLWQSSSSMPRIIYNYAIFIPAIIASSALMVAPIWIDSVSERYRTSILALSFLIFHTSFVLELNNPNGEYLFLIRCILAYSILVAYLAYFPPSSVRSKYGVHAVSHGTLYHIGKRGGYRYNMTTPTIVLVFIILFALMKQGMDHLLYSFYMPISDIAIDIVSTVGIIMLGYSIINILYKFEVIDLGIVHLSIGAKDIENIKKSLEFTEKDLVGLDSEVEQCLRTMDDIFFEFTAK